MDLMANSFSSKNHLEIYKKLNKLRSRSFNRSEYTESKKRAEKSFVEVEVIISTK